MRKLFLYLICSIAIASANPLVEQKCAECHNDEKAKGDFNLRYLGDGPTAKNIDLWLDALDLVTAGEMPPEDDVEVSDEESEQLIAWFETKVRDFDSGSQPVQLAPPRRMNNREFARSIADVLGIKDVGTHQPIDNLIGDTLHHGFDTHGETLGFSLFHLEQYVEAVRRIVDGTIPTGKRPESQTWEIGPDDIYARTLAQNANRRRDRGGTKEFFDFLDPRMIAYCKSFESVPETGRYRITIRATGKDRNIYDAHWTGIHEGDPIQLKIHFGDRVQTIDLPDEEEIKIELDEWLAAGTRFQLSYPTDGLKERSNGNFKFQYAIAGDYYRKYHNAEYKEMIAAIRAGKMGHPKRLTRPTSWHNWTDHWQGARPRIYGVTVEGPIYEKWPPRRSVDLLGKNPKVSEASRILKPIAERAWRRPVHEGELDRIVALVEASAESMSEVEALKEGVVAILVSPAFLLIQTEDLAPADRFASRLSYFLRGTTPTAQLRQKVQTGGLADFESILALVKGWMNSGDMDPFLRAFPTAWLELNDINFMAPDPDQFHFYHRKDLDEDMVNEVLHFFRHAMESNRPVPEFLTADYSFLNADLARIYDVKDQVPKDSVFRKYTFTDNRRGGLLGMGAFLTSTADSLGTSPIHRAVYVMENLMGIKPTPPPPDVEIKEPDVRQAKTIKEVLAAHVSDANCASCHEAIDPWGYAFENFDPSGAWRDSYTIPVALERGDDEENEGAKVVFRDETIPVDAAAKFRNGDAYNNITDFRKLVQTPANRDRFVRCFIAKLLTYANGVEPSGADYIEIEKIMETSAAHNYGIQETIAAVIDSPMFRKK